MTQRTFIALAAIAVAIGLMSCTTDDQASPSTPAGDGAASPAPAASADDDASPSPPSGDGAASPAPAASVGGGPPIPLETPIRVTAGDYVPPALSDEAQATGKALLDTAVGQSSRIVTMNGFRIGSGEVGSHPCPGQTEAGPADQHPIKIDYLPPNTFETYELYWRVCANGDTVVAGRFFRVSEVRFVDDPYPSQWDETSLYVRFINTERAYPFYIYAFQQVEVGTVNGRPAVFIKPVTPEGYGLSAILVASDDPEIGYLEIGASHLPFDELLKVAEGASCPGC